MRISAAFLFMAIDRATLAANGNIDLYIRAGVCRYTAPRCSLREHPPQGVQKNRLIWKDHPSCQVGLFLSGQVLPFGSPGFCTRCVLASLLARIMKTQQLRWLAVFRIDQPQILRA